MEDILGELESVKIGVQVLENRVKGFGNRVRGFWGEGKGGINWVKVHTKGAKGFTKEKKEMETQIRMIAYDKV
jgi:hypothetical protein